MLQRGTVEAGTVAARQGLSLDGANTGGRRGAGPEDVAVILNGLAYGAEILGWTAARNAATWIAWATVAWTALVMIRPIGSALPLMGLFLASLTLLIRSTRTTGCGLHQRCTSDQQCTHAQDQVFWHVHHGFPSRPNSKKGTEHRFDPPWSCRLVP